MRPLVLVAASALLGVACGSFGAEKDDPDGASPTTSDGGPTPGCGVLFCASFDGADLADGWTGLDKGPASEIGTTLTVTTDDPNTPPRAARFTIPPARLYEVHAFTKSFGSLSGKKTLVLSFQLRLVKPTTKTAETGRVNVAEITIAKRRDDGATLKTRIDVHATTNEIQAQTIFESPDADYTDFGSSVPLDGKWHAVSLAVTFAGSASVAEILVDGTSRGKTNIAPSVTPDDGETVVSVGAAYAGGTFTETIFDVDTVTFDAK